MSEVLEQVKSAAYTSVGVNLLVTDAIVGRELPAPEFIEEHAALARKHATKALKDSVPLLSRAPSGSPSNCPHRSPKQSPTTATKRGISSVSKPQR